MEENKKFKQDGSTLEEIFQDIENMVKKEKNKNKEAKKILDSAREQWECSSEYAT